MQVDITKDSYRVLCSLYREYLKRRKNGISKMEAVCFAAPSDFKDELFPDIPIDDLYDAITELGQTGFLTVYIDGSFQLEKSAIILMENRFTKGLTEVTDFIAKFIP